MADWHLQHCPVVGVRRDCRGQELGIEHAALRAFRHMAASELIENGVAPSVVQRQMRHSDSRITLQKYAHVIGDAQRRAVDSLAGRVLELTR
ncbi:MAG TPA: tyrosine-type recombinase/integrase [Candidatus Dormibacteraeota bacterium]|nr:tyrosine-type recombinase/integrase [Candidatus Dormibacteraeota bacterium]